MHPAALDAERLLETLVNEGGCMSRHGEVRYFSASRRDLVEIDGMPTSHLANAAKKLVGDLNLASPDDDPKTPAEIAASLRRDAQMAGGGVVAVLTAMIDELASRVPPSSSTPEADPFV